MSLLVLEHTQTMFMYLISTEGAITGWKSRQLGRVTPFGQGTNRQEDKKQPSENDSFRLLASLSCLNPGDCPST